MTAVLWGPLPVVALTLRQFAGSRALRIVAVLALIPALFALVYAIRPSEDTPAYFLAQTIYRDIFVATLLPIAVAILATGAIGNEIEDQTLPYLTLKPITRLRIVVEKLAATLMVATPLVFTGLIASYLLVFGSDSGASENRKFLWGMLASSFGGIVVYSALFILTSLFIQRALLAGISYALVWESLLGRYLPGLRYASVRHYTESIFLGIVKDPNLEQQDLTGVWASAITLLVVTIVAVILAAWRLRNLNLE